VGVAAMEVCRPLPFTALPRPGISNLVSRGLAGLVSRADPQGEAAADKGSGGQP
jgi:putative membrane protein